MAQTKLFFIPIVILYTIIIIMNQDGSHSPCIILLHYIIIIINPIKLVTKLVK